MNYTLVVWSGCETPLWKFSLTRKMSDALNEILNALTALNTKVDKLSNDMDTVKTDLQTVKTGLQEVQDRTGYIYEAQIRQEVADSSSVVVVKVIAT